MAFAWTCPFCNRDATINTLDNSSASHNFERVNRYGSWLRVTTKFIVCPNPNCAEFTLFAQVDALKSTWKKLAEFQLVPQTTMKAFPDFVPKAIRADYEEACLIRHLSPKASATLSRRCLQGMIRDFWNIKKVAY